MKHSFNFSASKHLPSANCDCGGSQLKKPKIKMEIFQGKLKYCSIDHRSNKIFTTKYNVIKIFFSSYKSPSLLHLESNLPSFNTMEILFRYFKYVLFYRDGLH